MIVDLITTPADEARARYVHELRRLADLIEREALPLPSAATSFSWYPSGDSAREQATTIAATLGGEWHAEAYGSGDYLHARTRLAPGQYGGAIVANISIKHERPEVPIAPAVAYVTELNHAATEARQALEALNDATLVCRGHRVDEWRSCADCNPQGVEQ